MPQPTYTQEGNMVRVTTADGSYLVPAAYAPQTPTGGAASSIQSTIEQAAAGNYQPPPPAVESAPALVNPPPQSTAESIASNFAPPPPTVDLGGRFAVNTAPQASAQTPAAAAPPKSKTDAVPYVWGTDATAGGLSEEAMRLGIGVGKQPQGQAPERYTGELAIAPGAGAPRPPAPAGGYAVARTVPAAWQEVGGVRKVLSPEVERAYDQLYLDREGGARDAYDRGVQRAQEDSAYIGELQAQIADRNAKLEELRGRIDSEKAKAIDDIRATGDDLANTRVDPLTNRDAKARITTGLMIGLGGIGSFFAGGPNLGMQMVQDSINREIDAQKTNYEIRRKGLADKQTVYGMMRDRFGSQIEAENAAKAALYEEAELKAKQYAAARGVDAQNEQYNAFMNDLNAAKLQHLNEINGVIEARYVPAHREILGGGMAAPKPKSEDRELMIPGYGVANSKADATAGKAAVQTMEEINAITGEIEKLTEGVGDRLDPAKRARVASLVTQLDLKTKNQAQLGALSASDAEMVAKLRGDPQAIVDWGGRTEGLKALREMTADGVRKFMHSHGVTGAQQYVREGPKGREVSVELTGDQARTVTPKADAPIVRKAGDKAAPQQMPMVQTPPPAYQPNQNAGGRR